MLLLKMVLPFPCKGVVDRYADRLNIKYFSKPNSGPGQTRNYGAERSEGEYLIIYWILMSSFPKATSMR